MNHPQRGGNRGLYIADSCNAITSKWSYNSGTQNIYGASIKDCSTDWVVHTYNDENPYGKLDDGASSVYGGVC